VGQHAVRVANLTNGGGLNGTTVLNLTTSFDDGVVDTLRGRTGLDWFFAAYLFDVLSDLNSGTESVTYYPPS
jgi:hypothetical protein